MIHLRRCFAKIEQDKVSGEEKTLVGKTLSWQSSTAEVGWLSGK